MQRTFTKAAHRRNDAFLQIFCLMTVILWDLWNILETNKEHSHVRNPQHGPQHLGLQVNNENVKQNGYVSA